MNYPQLIIYESDGSLASQVKEIAREHAWLVREPRDSQACLTLLRESRPSVLLLKLERRLVDEFNLLALLQQRVPDCPVVVFSDLKFEGATQRASLAALAYDLGARCVMFPPLTRTLVEDVAAGLMSATIARFVSSKGAADDA